MDTLQPAPSPLTDNACRTTEDASGGLLGVRGQNARHPTPFISHRRTPRRPDRD